MHQDENEEDGYDGEVPNESDCMMCGATEHDVHKTDRWNFQLGEDYFWLCRTCHSRFESIEQFDKFRQRHSDVRLYRSAAGLQTMLLKSGPPQVISLFIKAIIGRALADDRFAKYMKEELKKITSNDVLMEGENQCS